MTETTENTQNPPTQPPTPPAFADTIKLKVAEQITTGSLKNGAVANTLIAGMVEKELKRRDEIALRAYNLIFELRKDLKAKFNPDKNSIAVNPDTGDVVGTPSIPKSKFEEKKKMKEKLADLIKAFEKAFESGEAKDWDELNKKAAGGGNNDKKDNS